MNNYDTTKLMLIGFLIVVNIVVAFAIGVGIKNFWRSEIIRQETLDQQVFSAFDLN